MGTPDVDLQPGEILSDTYEIVRKVARGGMGSVYEAKHRRLSSRRLAIKVLRPDTNLSQREVARRFRREAEICSELSHPNIISVTDWDTAPNGQPFFVMEYLDGDGLDRRMARGRLPLPLVFRILAQVGAALHHAHERNIIHRDLKPSNIFLVSTGTGEADFVKVLDFGISKILTAGTLETTESKIIGSPRYMSPEQARGRNEEVTASSDQFGLATVAYEMLGGKPAFVGDTLSTVLFNIVYEQPEPLAELAPELPPKIIWAVNKAMAKEPANRYPSVVDFLGDLGDAAREAGALTGELADTLVGKARRRAPRRRWLRCSALVALAMGLVAVGLWLGTGTHPDPAMPRFDEAPAAAAGGGEEPFDRARGRPSGSVAEASDEGGTPTPPTKTVARPLASKPTPAPPPPELQAKLDRAQHFLDAGEHEAAIREAKRTIGKQDSAQARRIITLAYCSLGDLELAKASYRSVWRGDLARVSARCRELGVSL